MNKNPPYQVKYENENWNGIYAAPLRREIRFLGLSIEDQDKLLQMLEDGKTAKVIFKGKTYLYRKYTED